MGRVIAFDPGPSTGVAIFADGVRVWAGTIRDDDEPTAFVYTALNQLLAPDLKSDYNVIVVERFLAHTAAVGAAKSGRYTSMVCGFIDGTCKLHGLRLVWQSPSERKPYEARAKAMGGRTDHEISATAHGLAFLVRSGLLPIAAAT